MTTLADISEFQPNFDAPPYIAGGHPCVIVRAHNGWRPDNMWPVRRDYLRRYHFAAVGYYQYLVAARDAALQAADFIHAVGPLAPNEFAVLDLEEGSGDQTARATDWFNAVDAHYGRKATLYSGDWFGNSQLGGWRHWAGRPRWIASYSSVAPTDDHELWQNTDSFPFQGISSACDGSIFNGSAAQFAHLFAQHAAPHPTPHPAPQPAPSPLPKPPGVRDNVIATAVKPDGSIELFYEAADGEVLHTWQQHPQTTWFGAEENKRHAGWVSLGHPQQQRM